MKRLNHSQGILVLAMLIITIGVACNSLKQASDYNYPRPFDTTTKPIVLQDKKVYTFAEEGIYADNLFDGARLSDMTVESSGTLQAIIRPENEPINPSPWYAFRLWANESKVVNIHLRYHNAKHRYQPKVERIKDTWEAIDESLIRYDPDSMGVTFPVLVGPDTLMLAGQEVINSSDVATWCGNQATHPEVSYKSIGESRLGRKLLHLNIDSSEDAKKDVIVIISRQHPPEVTGYMAMEAFVDEILSESHLAKAFRSKYRIMVFPLMNPDGVDLGHWRHNAGGIDMNRDWAYYHQPENRQVADYIVQQTSKSQVVLGLDFHSTYYDIYYTRTDPSTLTGFKDYWLEGIKSAIPDYDPHDSPANGVSRPTSSAWFFTQFGAESVTYEIADTTSRNFINQKGHVSAQEMMQLLIYR